MKGRDIILLAFGIVITLLIGCGPPTFEGMIEPLKGIHKSPTGTSIEFTGKASPQAIIRDPKGVKISEISGLPDVRSILWDADGDSIFMTTGTPTMDNWENIGYYIYSSKERKVRIAAENEPGELVTHGRYIMIPQIHETLAKEMSLIIRVSGKGRYLVVDQADDFDTVMTLGDFMHRLEWAPDFERLAFLDMEKDKYGYYGDFVLKVADLENRRVRKILINSRRPSFLWHDNQTLAVATQDKYSVPSLMRFDLSGKGTKLVTAPEYMLLEPLKKYKVPGSIVYQGLTCSCMQKGYLWSIKPGGKPVRFTDPKRKGSRSQ